MYVPKNKCLIIKTTGTDVFGQQKIGDKLKEQCAIVSIVANDNKTTVRSDSSATRGNAQEMLYDAVILFGVRSKIAIHDVVEINGYKLEAMTVQPRYDINGELDHYQVEFKIWTRKTA